MLKMGFTTSNLLIFVNCGGGGGEVKTFFECKEAPFNTKYMYYHDNTSIDRTKIA